MISFIGEWIKQIAILIIMATFLDLLLPNSAMQRYVKLVIGLLLILVILTPILNIFNFDYERILTVQEGWVELADESLFSQRFALSKERIEAWQDDVFLDEVATSWEAEMQLQIESQFAVKVHELQFALVLQGEEVDVRALNLFLQEINSEEDGQLHKSDEVVPQIHPIVIEVSSSSRADKLSSRQVKGVGVEKKLEEEILTYLSTEWNISVDKMTCTWIRG